MLTLIARERVTALPCFGISSGARFKFAKNMEFG